MSSWVVRDVCSGIGVSEIKLCTSGYNQGRVSRLLATLFHLTASNIDA